MRAGLETDHGFFLLAPWFDRPLFGGGRIIAVGPRATMAGRFASASARMEAFGFGDPWR